MNNKRKKRCVIYDFDGTIFKSPDRDAGELAYFTETGQMFTFPGWWGRLESLIPPVVPDKPSEDWFISDTISAYREDFKDENTEVILMTGRPYKHRKRIFEICEHYDLLFDNHYFRGQPGQKGRDTLEIKANLITEHVINKELRKLEIWEDRPEHTSSFFNLAKSWKSKYLHLEEIIIHDVLKGTSNLV